ncbi:hypothetical protein ACFOWM_13175 [Ferruginibacter yonginensis]|uniref:Uncharacterized protein n=1 Tax=Ferruginibacter yonginensis TaxID=1310416 RepID=A0ABV8QVS4_9BACT
MRNLIFLITFLKLDMFSFGQNPKLISFNANIDSIVNYGPIKAYDTMNDTVGAFFYRRMVSFTFHLENKSKRKLLVPVEFLIGTDFWNDILFAAERWNDSLKQFQPIKKDLVLPAYREMKYRVLYWGDNIIEKGEFNYFTQMNEINRVRFTLLLSKNNNGFKDITTEWLIIKPQEPMYPFFYSNNK